MSGPKVPAPPLDRGRFPVRLPAPCVPRWLDERLRHLQRALALREEREVPLTEAQRRAMEAGVEKAIAEVERDRDPDSE